MGFLKSRDAVKELIREHLDSFQGKSPQYVADVLGHPIAMSMYSSSREQLRGDWYVFKYKPRLDYENDDWETRFGWWLPICPATLEYNGAWDDSLTFPSYWDEVVIKGR